MPKQRIYSVHQRSKTSPGFERELAVFTDDAMANQAIDHLYRYAWQDIVKGTASETWFSGSELPLIVAQGFDVWAVNDKNSLLPIFFKRPHDLWNQVPPSAADLRFTQEVVDGGNVPVEEVKRVF
jgi:hypothetical protein